MIQDAITIGTIVAFAAYLTRLYGPISSLTNMQVEFAQAMVSFERVFEYLDMPVEIADRPDARPLHEVSGARAASRTSGSSIRKMGRRPRAPTETGTGRNRVDAGHASSNGDSGRDGAEAGDKVDDEVDNDAGNLHAVPVHRLWALEDVSFSIEPGELVALVGPSGAGKTTITYLLPRLYDPTRGGIRLDGVDLRDTTQESIAHQIGMVTQETYLFHDTIRANLLYARPDASADETRERHAEPPISTT